MGANARSTVGTATDANAMLRVLFSRLGKPHIGPSNAFSFNIPSVRAVGSITVEKAGRSTEQVTFTRAGGMCPRCEGMGSVTDIDVSQLVNENKSLAEGAITVPGYTADGWSVRIFTQSGFLDPLKPIRKYSKKERQSRLCWPGYATPWIRSSRSGSVISVSIVHRARSPAAKRSARRWSVISDRR
jgi:excinuclease UvrABC ATPase subunit